LPGGSGATPGDIASAELCFAYLNVSGIQGFGDISKVGLLVFLELWLRMYPLSCGSG